MALYKSNVAEYPSLRPAVTASQAGIVFVSVGAAAVDTDLAAEDLIVLCKLPAFHQPVDFILEATELDDATSIVLSVGILNADEDDLVADIKFIHESTVAQAGGVKRADVLSGLGLAPSNADRWIAAYVDTVAGTEKAGTVRGKLFYCENPS